MHGTIFGQNSQDVAPLGSGTAFLPGDIADYDAIVESVASLLDCPMACLAMVEDNRLRLVSCQGLDTTQIPLQSSFCGQAVEDRSVLVVSDAQNDPRFKENALVRGSEKVRFYAGCPISIDGVNQSGALCVMDTRPRMPEHGQLSHLTRLGRIVESFAKVHEAGREAERASMQALLDQHPSHRESELFQEVANVTGVGGWEFCLRTEKLTWTAKTYEIHEVPFDYEPTAEKALEFYTPEARAKISNVIDHAIKSLSCWDEEATFVTATGRSIWVQAVGRPIVENGRVVRLVGSFMDITQKKKEEEELRQSELIQRATLQTLVAGVMLIARSGTVHSINEAGAELLGFSQAEILSTPLAELEQQLELRFSDQDYSGGLFQTALSNPEEIKDSLVFVKRKGKSGGHWLRITADPIEADYNDFDGVVVSYKDMNKLRREQKALQAIFDNFPGGIAIRDAEMKLVNYNEKFQEYFEFPKELLDQSPSRRELLLHMAMRGDFGLGDPEQLADKAYRIEDLSKPTEYERTTPSGRVLDVRFTPLPDGGVVSCFFDITDRKRLEQQLLQKEQLAKFQLVELETIIENLGQGVCVFDKNGRLSLWNRKYIDLLTRPEDLIREGVSITEILNFEKRRGEFIGNVDAHVINMMERLAKGETVRFKLFRKDGRIIGLLHAPLPDGGWIGTYEDVTLREQATARITHAAHHDDLTGLANRILFNRVFNEAINDVQLQRAQGYLLLVDLDRFKPVNDTYGHFAGDELLKQAAQRMRDSIRSTDLVARLGGDEFAIILRGSSPGHGRTAEIADKLIGNLNQPFEVSGNAITIGVSIGIAKIAEYASDADGILKEADLALYLAKNRGRNNYKFFAGS